MTARKPKAAKMTAATSLDELTPNLQNPRNPFTPEQVAAFRESLQRFGDLGGIIRNRTTGRLIGGHKRTDVFRSATKTEIVTTPQPKDGQGTVAYGYVLVDGARFSYREVEWTPETEVAGNLAANRWAAAWDWPLVAEALKSIDDTELRGLIGFSEGELANLLAAEWHPPAKTDLLSEPSGDHTIKLSDEQYALLVRVKLELDPTSAMTDATAIETVCQQWLTRPH